MSGQPFVAGYLRQPSGKSFTSYEKWTANP